MRRAYSNKLAEYAMKTYGYRPNRILFYPLITGKGFQDVRKVFNQTRQEDKELIDYYAPYVKGYKDLFDKVTRIAIAVEKRLTYKFDKDNYGRVEYWAKPIETHRKRVDDCDGYSVLITYLCRLFGVPPWQVFTATGYVKNGVNKEFHAYTVVIDLDTGLMYPVEGSFHHEDSMMGLGNEPLNKLLRYYKGEIAWLTNDLYSFSRTPLLRFVK